jgi:hypothetical protein
MLTYLGCIYANHWNSNLSWRNYQKALDTYNEFYEGFETIEENGRYWDLETRFHPRNFRLGGTPLDQCLVILRKILPEFNAQYGIEKSILTVITDGFSHGAEYLKKSYEEAEDYKEQEKNCNNGSEYWRTTTSRDLIDPYTNKVFPLTNPSSYSGRNSFSTTQNILEWISQTCNVTITGYFVLDGKRDLYPVIAETKEYKTSNIDVDATWREIRKEGKVFSAHGYNKLFLAAGNTLGTAGSDELGEEFIDAKKTRVMAAFKRNQKSKTTSRFLTNEFIKEIA